MNDTARRCVGVILAGGLATRMMGAAKGTLTVGEEPIVQRVADVLGAVSDTVLLSVATDDLDGVLPDLPRVRDRFAARGPLSGIHAALATEKADAVVCAWDMPYVPSALLAELRRLGETGYDAVLPVGTYGPAEPLSAWYGRSALATIERWLASNAAGPIVRALRECNVLLLDLQTVRQFGDPQIMFLNVNTQDDLMRARSYTPKTLHQ